MLIYASEKDIREIRRECAYMISQFSISEKAFQRLACEIAYDFNNEVRLQAPALGALQAAAEAWLTRIFEGRQTLIPTVTLRCDMMLTL